MLANPKADSGLPEATLFIGGPGLDPDAVTLAVGEAPHKSSDGPHPRWFWTSAGRIQSADADDHLRAVLDLARAFERQRDAFPTAELRASLFLPDTTPRRGYSKALVRDLLRHGSVTLNLSSSDEPVELSATTDGRTEAIHRLA